MCCSDEEEKATEGKIVVSEVNKGDRVKKTTKWMIIINLINRQAMDKHVPITHLPTNTHAKQYLFMGWQAARPPANWTDKHPGWR